MLLPLEIMARLEQNLICILSTHVPQAACIYRALNDCARGASIRIHGALAELGAIYTTIHALTFYLSLWGIRSTLCSRAHPFTRRFAWRAMVTVLVTSCSRRIQTQLTIVRIVDAAYKQRLKRNVGFNNYA